MKLHKLHIPSSMLLSIVLVTSLAMYYEPQPAFADTFVVPSVAYPTIQSAVDAATAAGGGTVEVYTKFVEGAPVPYYEAVVVDGTGIEIIGKEVDGIKPTNNANYYPAFNIDGDGNTLSGFIAKAKYNIIVISGKNHIISYNDASNGKRGIVSDAPNTTIEYNITTNNEKDGIKSLAPDAIIMYNTSTNNGDNGILVKSRDSLVDNNVAGNNGNNNIGIFGRDITISNNTVYGGYDGIDLNGFNFIVMGNTVGFDAGGDAIPVSHDAFDGDNRDSTYDSNTAVGSGDDGFDQHGVRNTYDNNMASGSGDFDFKLVDSKDNTGTGNTFGTTDITGKNNNIS